MRPNTGIAVDIRKGWAYMFARRAKFGAYLVTLAGLALSQGLLHGDTQTVAELIVAAAGAVGVHQVPNAAKKP